MVRTAARANGGGVPDAGICGLFQRRPVGHSARGRAKPTEQPE